MIKLTNLLEEIDEGLFDDLKNKIMGRPVVKKSGSIWSHSGEEGSFGAKFGDRIEYFDTKEGAQRFAKTGYGHSTGGDEQTGERKLHPRVEKDIKNVSWKEPRPSDNVMIEVDLDRLLQANKESDPDHHVERGNQNDLGRIDGAKEFWVTNSKNKEVDFIPTEVSRDFGNRTAISNGRHRLQAMKELGYKKTMISVPKNSVEKFNDIRTTDTYIQSDLNGNRVEKKGLPKSDEVDKRDTGENNLVNMIKDDSNKVNVAWRYFPNDAKEEVEGEYVNNNVTNSLAPNLAKQYGGVEGLIKHLIKPSKPVLLKPEQWKEVNNTEAGEILGFDNIEDASNFARERGQSYGKDVSGIEQGLMGDEEFPSPIIIRDKNGDMHCMAGNTRTMLSLSRGRNIPVKIIDYDGEFDYEASDRAAEEESMNEYSDEYINKYYRDLEKKRKKRKKVGAVGAIRFGKLLPGESKNIKTGWGDNSDTFLPQRVMVRKYPKRYVKLKDLIKKA